MQQEAEAIWHDAGIVVSPGKSVIAAESGVELGVFVGGNGQWLGASAERLVKVCKSTIWLLGQRGLSRKKVQVIMGRWCFILQFRRPAMAHFSDVWEWLGSQGLQPRLERFTRDELLLILMGLPLYHTWLGAKIDMVTTCSDASPTGGAVAIGRSLTTAGASFLSSQERANLPECVPVVVISQFNGIGGAARCYDIAGVKVRAMVACDIHAPANRVVARRWPETMFHEDARTLTKDVLLELLKDVGDFEAVHLYGQVFPASM